MSTWHGFQITGKTRALHIGPLPRRKKIALYFLDDSKFVILGWFVSKQAAQDTLAHMNMLIFTSINAVGTPR